MSAPSSFTFRCSTAGCNETYRGRLELSGKWMVCRGCRKKIRIPAPRNPSGRKSLPHRAPQRTPTESDRQDEYEVVQDGAGEGDLGYEVVDGSPPAAPEVVAAWTVPAAAPPTALEPPQVKRKKRPKNSLQFLEDIVDSPKLLFIFGSALALVLIAFGIFFAPLALAMRLIGGLFTGVGFIYALRLAFDESPSCGVFYLLDCTQVYRIYYTVTRWSDMKHAFFAEIFGVLLFVPWVVLTTEDLVNREPLNLDDFKQPPIELPVDAIEMDDDLQGRLGRPERSQSAGRTVLAATPRGRNHSTSGCNFSEFCVYLDSSRDGARPIALKGVADVAAPGSLGCIEFWG